MGETQTTAQKPLPCPFCGAENVTIAEGSTYRWAHAVCAECGAAAGDIRRQYGEGTDNPEVQEAAIAEWNTRDRREIDALIAQRDEATAKAKALTLEVERLRPAAEAWEAWRECDELIAGMPLTRDTEQEQAVQDAAAKRSAAYACARAANVEALAREAALKSAHVRGDA